MVSVQESSRRRRLISASCKGILPHDQMMSIVHLCDQQFGHSEQLLPVRLFRSAQLILNFSADAARTLVRRFAEKQHLSADALGPDPLSASENVVNRNESKQSNESRQSDETNHFKEPEPLPKRAVSVAQTLNTREKSAREIVFEFVVGKLLSRLDAANRSDVATYLLQSVSQAQLLAQTKVMLGGWIRGNAQQTSDMTPVSPDDMSQVFDLVYSWYCEILGPVRADKAVAEVINHAEALLPEAREFSPRKLL